MTMPRAILLERIDTGWLLSYNRGLYATETKEHYSTMFDVAAALLRLALECK